MIAAGIRRIANTETYKLNDLYPDTLYYIWLAARSQRGEGATTPPIPVRTKQYGKIWIVNLYEYFLRFYFPLNCAKSPCSSSDICGSLILFLFFFFSYREECISGFQLSSWRGWKYLKKSRFQSVWPLAKILKNSLDDFLDEMMGSTDVLDLTYYCSAYSNDSKIQKNLTSNFKFQPQEANIWKYFA